jgi:DNA processing protein
MEQSAPVIKGTIRTIQSKAEDFPEVLRHIPQPPSQLFIRGALPDDFLMRPRIAIVGSRKVTPYGQAITAQLAEELARAGVVVISGLAIGVDGIAHRAALGAGGLTIAVLAGGLDHVYPATHHQLAQQILDQGGALVSEYSEGAPTYKQNFIERNRLVSGLSQAVLITEATEKSGTLHTARFALEQGRDVLAVPGNINSPASIGTNNLIKSGATPIASINDVLHALSVRQMSPKLRIKGSTPEEQLLLDLLAAGENEGSILLARSNLAITQFNQTLTMLEITGKVRSLGANRWTL